MKQSLKIAVAGVGVGMVSLAGAGLASAHSPGDSEARDEITNRVAEILGVDAANLGDAMEQAREEHRSDEMDARLDQAVVDGTITQEEADEIRTWLDSRPEVLEELKGERGHHGPEQNGGGGGLEERLAAMVEDGTITEVGRIDHADPNSTEGDTDCRAITGDDLPTTDMNEFQTEFEYMVVDGYGLVLDCADGQARTAVGFQCKGHNLP